MTRIASTALQQSFWNGWNASISKEVLDNASKRQAEVICGWLEALGRRNLDIVEVGCGSGWLCPLLTRFGRVTGTDLSDQGLVRARQRAPEVTFLRGDFMDMDFAANSFDVAVTL